MISEGWSAWLCSLSVLVKAAEDEGAETYAVSVVWVSALSELVSGLARLVATCCWRLSDRASA